MGRRKQITPRSLLKDNMTSVRSETHTNLKASRRSLKNTTFKSKSKTSTITYSRMNDLRLRNTQIPYNFRKKLRPLVCYHCFKVFYTKSSLQRHTRLRNNVVKVHKKLSPHLRKLKFKSLKKDILFKHNNDTYESEELVDLSIASPPVMTKNEPYFEGSPPPINDCQTRTNSQPNESSPMNEGHIICPSCQKELPNLMQFILHMSKNHSTNQNAPRITSPTYLTNRNKGSIFNSSAFSELSEESSFSGYPLNYSSVCAFCGGVVSGPHSALLHLEKHCVQIRDIKHCSECPAETLDAAVIQSHGLEKHCSMVWRCDICLEVFDSQFLFDEHYTNIHAETKRLSACLLCSAYTPGKLFDAEELRQHFVTKHLQLAPPIGELKQTLPKLTPAYAQRSDSEEAPTYEDRESKVRSESVSPRMIPFLKRETFENSPITAAYPLAGGGGTLVPGPGHLIDEVFSQTCHICRKVFPDEMTVLKHQMKEHRLIENNEDDSSDHKNKNSLSQVSKNSKSDLKEMTECTSQVVSGRRQSNSRAPYSHPLPLRYNNSKLTCSYCLQNYRSQSDLERHISNSHYTKPHILKCNICDDLFPNQTALKEHKETHKRAPTPPQSESSGKLQSMTIANLQQTSTAVRTNRVVQQGASPLSFNCCLCRQIFEHDSLFLFHMKTAHYDQLSSPYQNADMVKCSFCYQVVSSMKETVIHSYKHSFEDGGDSITKALSKGFPDHNSLNNSLSANYCRLCGKSDGLNLSGDLLCAICKLTLTYLKQGIQPISSRLTIPHATATPPSPYSRAEQKTSPTYMCDQCGQSFSSTFQLEMHTITHQVAGTSDNQTSTSNTPGEKPFKAEKKTMMRRCRLNRCFNSSREIPGNTREISGKSLEDRNRSVFTCLVCDESYSDEVKFHLHKELHWKSLKLEGHDVDDDNEPQTEDESKAPSNSSLNEEQVDKSKRYGLSQKLSCTKCHQKFQSWSSLRLHKTLKHNSRSGKV